jgi:RHS repeat-associated protein
MTASPNRTYSNDLVGNRTAMTTSGDDPEYTWDLLNRMTEFQFDDGGGDAVTYKYRADGMRTYKIDTTGANTETRYFHDGQMCVQDTHDDGTDVTVAKYGVGARGIDVITRKENAGSETFGYPLYDTHGNMIATLARAPTHDFTTGNEKTYDVWGGDRSGSSSVDQGYVANLGHRTDSESALQYMRARYYEPSTGRFISLDAVRDGFNWYVYASNSPDNKVDASGNADYWTWMRFVGGMMTSTLFLISVAVLLVSGLLVALAPFTWMVSLAFIYVAVNVGWELGFTVIKDQNGKLFPNIESYAKPDGKTGGRYKAGILLEVIGFFVGWYGLLELLFSNMDEAVVGS